MTIQDDIQGALTRPRLIEFFATAKRALVELPPDTDAELAAFIVGLSIGTPYDDLPISRKRLRRTLWMLTEPCAVFKDQVIKRDGRVCYLCGNPVSHRKLSIDHVIPIGRGGHRAIENLRVAHAACNNIKGDMTLDEFRAKYPNFHSTTQSSVAHSQRVSNHG